MTRVRAWLHEPWVINAAQTVQYLAAILAGAMAYTGVANPAFLSTTVSGPVIAGVGLTFVVGGVVGAFSVIKGLWWLERIALWVVGLGLGALLIPAVYYSIVGHNPAIWIVLFLVIFAICDVFKRYRRIDWAYLDPAK